MTESVMERPARATRTPIHLWVVGVLSLLWNAMGAFDYVATQMELDFYMSGFTEAQLEYFYGFPAWVVAAWAIAVWSAVAGSVGLLLRRRWAVWAFGLSIAGMVITTLHNFVLTNGAEVMGTVGVVFTVVIWVVAIFLLFYARRQAERGVLV